MQRYPELFDPEYVDWWFENENSLANGDAPVPRPKPFWVPTGIQRGITEDTNANDLKAARKATKKKRKGFM